MEQERRSWPRKAANAVPAIGLMLLVMIVPLPVLASAGDQAPASRAVTPPHQGPEVSAFGDSCSSSIFCPDCIVKIIGGTFVEFCGLSKSNGFCTCQNSGSSCSVTGSCTYSGWGGGGPPNN